MLASYNQELNRYEGNAELSKIEDAQLQSPGMKHLRREHWPRVIKEETSALKEKWESAISGKQLYNVRKWSYSDNRAERLPHENSEPAVEKLKDQFEIDQSDVARDTASLTAVAPAVEADGPSVRLSLALHQRGVFCRNDSNRRCVDPLLPAMKLFAQYVLGPKRPSGRLFLATACSLVHSKFRRGRKWAVVNVMTLTSDRPLRPARFRLGGKSGRLFLVKATSLRAHSTFTSGKKTGPYLS